jgi:WD40 repeat protein
MGKLKTKLQPDTVLVLGEHTEEVWAVAVTPDGTRAVSAFFDMTLRVWDLATGKALATLGGHTAAVWAVAVTPDGTRAVSAFFDMTLRVWDLSRGSRPQSKRCVVRRVSDALSARSDKN